MQGMNTQENFRTETVEQHEPIEVDAKFMDSVVLQRLIEEVKFEREHNVLAYNRTHNRHNRGR